MNTHNSSKRDELFARLAMMRGERDRAVSGPAAQLRDAQALLEELRTKLSAAESVVREATKTFEATRGRFTPMIAEAEVAVRSLAPKEIAALVEQINRRLADIQFRSAANQNHVDAAKRLLELRRVVARFDRLTNEEVYRRIGHAREELQAILQIADTPAVAA